MLNRRDLLSGFAMSGMEAEGQQHAPESLYIPKPHLVQDRAFLHAFMAEFPFVDLVTAVPSLRITHIPVLVDSSRGPFGAIFGHIARQNPQAHAFDGKQPAVMVFHGPHSYISPSWYAKPEAVPTWNFAVVHAGGTLKPIEDRKALHDLLARLIDKFEGVENPRYDFRALSESYKYGMIGGIIGFEMEIELLEGKFKLGQERSEADREGILRGLRAAAPERSAYQLTADFYTRSRKSGE